MTELAIAYALESQYGRAVFGNCDAATADADFVGYLDAENPITGLLDMPPSRLAGGNLPGGDGGYDGPGLRGRRQGTISGMIPVAGMTLANMRRDALEAAADNLEDRAEAVRDQGEKQGEAVDDADVNAAAMSNEQKAALVNGSAALR